MLQSENCANDGHEGECRQTKCTCVCHGIDWEHWTKTIPGGLPTKDNITWESIQPVRDRVIELKKDARYIAAVMNDSPHKRDPLLRDESFYNWFLKDNWSEIIRAVEGHVEEHAAKCCSGGPTCPRWTEGIND